jgi:hypothetical protein
VTELMRLIEAHFRMVTILSPRCVVGPLRWMVGSGIFRRPYSFLGTSLNRRLPGLP